MTQRLVRWALFLSEFNFKIVYRAGSANGKPDALSRRPDYASENDNLSSCEVPFTVLRPENFCAITSFVSSLNDQILNECKNDEFYSDIYNELNSNDSNNSRLKNFSISNSFLLFKIKSMFLQNVVLPFLTSAMILPQLVIMELRRLLL